MVQDEFDRDLGTVQGTITFTATGAQTFPKSGLYLVGLEVQGGAAGGYVSVPIDASRNAVFPADVSSTRRYALNHKITGQSVTFTVTGASRITAYYSEGAPDRGKPLMAYNADVQTRTGNGTVSHNLQGATGIVSVALVGQDAGANATFSPETGVSLTYYTPQAGCEDFIIPTNAKASQTVTVTIAGATNAVYSVLYWQ